MGNIRSQVIPKEKQTEFRISKSDKNNLSVIMYLLGMGVRKEQFDKPFKETDRYIFFRVAGDKLNKTKPMF